MLKFFFRENPMARLVLFIVTGIILARYYPSGKEFFLPVLLLILPVWAVYHFLLHRHNRRKNLRGYFVFLSMVTLGAWIYCLQTSHSEVQESPAYYEGIISVKPLIKGSYFQTDCLITARRTGEKSIALREKVRLYVEYTRDRSLPETGDSLYFHASLQRIKNRRNPGEFDYAGYMEDEGIRYSAYIRQDEYVAGGNSGRLRLQRLASRFRSKLNDKFIRAGIADAELGVLSALVTGDRQYLDQDTRSAYIGAGAMHVLAVSGLHVGILYLFLGLLLVDRTRLRAYRFLRLLIILGVLWLYAFMTGLSTSVLRASIMFSIFLIGKSFDRTSGSYNLLAASALIILFIDPCELFKAGFQYSFLAVLGILYFQPKLERLLTFRHGLPDRIWQLITVSLSAQLSTFPLALYYFHQFPAYFLLTNIVIIPLVWLIMVFALIFFLAPPAFHILEVVAWTLNTLVHLCNTVIRYISSIRGSAIVDIRFENYDLIVSSLLILLVIWISERKRGRLIPILLTAYACILLGGAIAGFPSTTEPPRLIIYNLKDQQVMSYIHGPRHLLITGKADKKSLEYLNSYWVSRQLNFSNRKIVTEDYAGKLLELDNVRIQVDSNAWLVQSGNTKIIYAPGGNPFVRCEGEKECWLIDACYGFPGRTNYAPEKIILLDGLPERLKSAWKDFALKQAVFVHDMQTLGAYEFVLPEL